MTRTIAGAAPPHDADEQIVFAIAPTAVTRGDGAWQITHRGQTVGRLPTLHRGDLPFTALQSACERVIDIEMARSDARAAAAAADLAYNFGRAQQLRRERRRINTRVLARRALTTLDVNELVALADAARAGDDKAVSTQLRRITGGALRRQQPMTAIASKTLELLGADAIRDAVTNRAARRARARSTLPATAAA